MEVMVVYVNTLAIGAPIMRGNVIVALATIQVPIFMVYQKPITIVMVAVNVIVCHIHLGVMIKLCIFLFVLFFVIFYRIDKWMCEKLWKM